MDLGLRGKNAIVIGASKGLGLEISQELANEGVRVGLIARDSIRLKEITRKLNIKQGKNWSYAVDLIPEFGTSELLAFLKRKKTNFDIVIHNLGGTLGISDPLCSVEEWRKVWRLNLEIAIELNRTFIPQMVKKGWGRIIHISSNAAGLNHGALPYGTIKAALNAYTRNIGAVYASHGVGICSIMPGPIISEGNIWDRRMKENPEEIAKLLERNFPLKRFSSTGEICKFVLFLASNWSSFFSGTVIPIDGGAR